MDASSRSLPRKRIAFVAGKDIGVVPAKAGTHTPRRSFQATIFDDFRATAESCGYGSPRARGRRWSETHLRHPATRMRPSCSRIFPPFTKKGRGECRVLDAPAVSRAKMKKHTR